MRKGSLSFNEIAGVTVVLILLVFIGYVTLGTQLDKPRKLEYTRIDAQRVYTSIKSMSGVGTGQMDLDLNNDYNSISISDNTLEFGAGFLDDPVKVNLPPEYSYSTGSLSAGELCVLKNGMSVKLDSSCQSQEPCDEGTCAVLENDGSPDRGFRCKGGVYTSEGFFQHYYSSSKCGGPSDDSFVDINRFSCPDLVEEGRETGCVVETTWRCDGDVDLSMEDESDTIACGDGITHERWFAPFTASGSGTQDFTVVVELPSGETSSMTRQVKVG